MTNSIVFIVLGISAIITGVFFVLFGCIGLIRLPNVYNRLQAATKCVTLGSCSILLGVIFFYGLSSIGAKALVGIFFIALTSPTAAHAISRASYRSGIKLWENSVRDDYAGDVKEIIKKEEQL